MVNAKLRIVLQGIVKHREGKKWKKRYCLLSVPPKNEDALHLYLAKSYDDFTPYRNENCITDYQPPSCDRNVNYDSCLRQFGGYKDISVPESDPSIDACGQSERPVQTLVNTATQSCQAAADSTAAGLSYAATLAARLNAPAPVDEITGFESGYHMDKESNIVVLIGISSVHVIALQGTDEMFRWAEALSQILTDNHFRVTLRKCADGCKLPQGLQGTLHVQRWRLCLVGEPSAGCKFICSWRLDSILKAYTVSSSAASGHIENSAGGNPRRISFGNTSISGGHLPSSTNRPKTLLYLEADQSAGKGRGAHTFELDGGSLAALTSAIETFMNRRYAPIKNVQRFSISSQDRKITPAVSFNKKPHSVHCPAAPVHPSSNFLRPSRHSTESNFHSTASKPNVIQEFAPRSSPLPVPVNLNRTESSANYLIPDNGTSVYGLSVPNYPGHHYSNLIPTGPSSLSPTDLMMLDTNNRSTSNSTGTTDMDPAAAAGCGSASLESRHSIRTGFISQPVTRTDHSKQSSTDPDHPIHLCPHLGDCCPCCPVSSHSHPYSRLLVEKGSDSLMRASTEHVPDEGPQVARVAAGLVISKWGSGTPNQQTSASKLANTHLPSCQSLQPGCTEAQPRVKQASCSTTDGKPVPHPHRPFRCTRSCRRRRKSPLYGAPPSVTSCDFATTTAAPLHQSEVASFPDKMTHQGIFRADEDISDTEQSFPRRTSDLDAQASSRLGRDRRLSQQLDPSGADWEFRESSSLLFNHVYRIYRHRHRQYRSCLCLTYIGRSLSTDLLYNLSVSIPPSMGVLRSYNEAVDERLYTAARTPPLLAIAFDCNQSPSNSSAVKLFGGGAKWRNLYRLFHRKHSKSQDSLHKHLACGPGSISSSMTDGSLGSDRGDLDGLSINKSSPKNPSVGCTIPSTNPSNKPRHVLVQCSRHGLLSYNTWLESLHTLCADVPACDRPHRKTGHGTVNLIATSKNKLPCTFCLTSTATGGGSSIVSSLRGLISMRYKSRGSVTRGKAQVRRRISTPVKEMPHAHSVLTGAANSVPFGFRSKRSTSSCSKAQHPSGDVNGMDPFGLTRANDLERRCHSTLSLTSGTCSEPTLSTLNHHSFWFRNPGLRLLNFSAYSSVSSLPTSHSISGSSSLISAPAGGRPRIACKRHSAKAYMNSSDIQSQLLGSHEPTWRTRSSSFCEADPMLSHSVYGEEVRTHSGCDVTPNVYVDFSPIKSPLTSHSYATRCSQDFECPMDSQSGVPVYAQLRHPNTEHICNQLAETQPPVSDVEDKQPCADCIRIQQRVQHSQRSNTLPLSKVVSREKDCGIFHLNATNPSSDIAESSKPTVKSSIARLSRRVRRSFRYNTATGSVLPMSTTHGLDDRSPGRSKDGGMIQTPDDSVGSQNLYCNLKTLQQGTGANKSGISYLKSDDLPVESSPGDRHQAVQSPYVNLPLAEAKSADRGTRHILQVLQRNTLNTSRPKAVAGSPSLVGVLESTSALVNRSQLSTVPNTSGATCSCGMPVNSCCAVTPKLTEVPAEVRDPSRNYAIVDLRPSPASSVNMNTELARGLIHYHPKSQSTNSTNSSGGSAVGTSTSTGSDCASDAATLTSDTLGSYATAVVESTQQSSSSAVEFPRRRHSHSMSSAISEAPALNYVHVIASTSTSMSTPHTIRRLGKGPSISDSAGCVIAERTDSPSSSSGLGGIASQSVTPPLAAAGSVTFGDVFTSRSMSSSATSSGEVAATADPGFHSTSPMDDESVAYTQIDFTRTLALGEVRGSIEQQSSAGMPQHVRPQGVSGKGERSVRKTFSRPIRSIRRCQQKKTNS